MELDKEISNLEKLLPGRATRHRRGLIDFGGQALKFLFGTATSAEVQDLQSIVSKFDNKNDDIIHAVQAQLTLLRTVDKETRQNTVDLLNLARVLKQLTIDVINANFSFTTAIDKLTTMVAIQKNVSRHMRELEFAALRLQQELIQLQEGLDVTSLGRLSSVLLPPSNLSSLLGQIALKLPRDVSLITNTEIDNMYIYYDIAKVQVYATESSIRLVVRIPLRGADRAMSLYKVEPLPTFSALLNRLMQLEPQVKYFAVTENRQCYALLKQADIQNCKHGLLTICDATFPLIHKRVGSCTSALYFGQDEVAHDFCRKLILRPNFKPVWIYAKGKMPFWVYSLPTSTRVTKTCKVNGTNYSKDMILNGAGILQEDINCQYFSESFILLPVTDSYSNFTLTTGNVIAPELPQLMSDEENQQLETYRDEANSTLATLESVMRRDTSTHQQKYIELSQLLQKMEQEKTTQRTTQWLTFGVSSPFILIIMLLTLKYCRGLRNTTYNRMLAWRNGKASRKQSAPKPRQQKQAALSTIAEEVSPITAELLPQQDETCQSGPVRATTIELHDLRSKTTDLPAGKGNTEPRFSRPGMVQLP
ncbi:hypothetical protein L798_09317 [Zootermopsis nevadensis]|uniref:Envelope fusion protein n=1 Tax=Zootermopsis nevadensis TaxID=136037 RepID=A0A067R491_ZOONE|nr:hypothetical protein L798_09317 [Zootermopsis nevadensis]